MLDLSNVLTFQKLQKRSCKVCVLPTLGMPKSPGLQLGVQLCINIPTQ